MNFFKLPLFFLLIGLFVQTGCGASYSNTLFEEDGAFRSALPTQEDINVALAEGNSGKVSTIENCREGELYQLTFDNIHNLNSITNSLLGLLQDIQETPITKRSDNSRTWGPFMRSDGLFFTLVVERREIREADTLLFRYFYWLNTAYEESSEGNPVLWGQWDPDYELETGIGSFTFELGSLAYYGDAQQAGELELSYDTRGARSIQAAFIDQRPIDAPEGAGRNTEMFYENNGQHGGTFAYETLANLVNQTSALEQLEVVSQWDKSGFGRAEGWAFDGDLGLEALSIVECWGTDRCLDYYWDSEDLHPDTGNPGLCEIQDVTVPTGF